MPGFGTRLDGASNEGGDVKAMAERGTENLREGRASGTFSVGKPGRGLQFRAVEARKMAEFVGQGTLLRQHQQQQKA
jgi:hypothetical protein